MYQRYLNNSGTRWENILPEGKYEKILVHDGETTKPRVVVFWEQCGNFAYPRVRIKGKRVTVYPDSDCPNPDDSPMIWAPYEIHKARLDKAMEEYRNACKS